MKLLLRHGILMFGIAAHFSSLAQNADERAISKFLDRATKTAKQMNRRITDQSEKYLSRMSDLEVSLNQEISKTDPNAAQKIFEQSSRQYQSWSEKIRSNNIQSNANIPGEYRPYIDSLQGMIKFLKEAGSSNPILTKKITNASEQLNALQTKFQDAEQIKGFIRSRRDAVTHYIKTTTNLPSSLSAQYQAMGKQVYYYSQTVREYKEMLNDPDKLQRKALAALNKLPAFQSFMKQHSQLAGLFGMPADYASPEALIGLQTKEMVAGSIQDRLAISGPNAGAILHTNLVSAQTQLSTYKSKISQLGQGSGDIDMPDFKPNSQKTKTFWKRLEYGTNFQTTWTDYYFPTTSDLGGSIGYKFSDKFVAGLGASYKLGWGNGIKHISFSSQGAGLRSYFDINIKRSFFASGGFEYNYRNGFANLQQLRTLDNWSKSGLIGLSKIVSMKSRAFKKTKASLLWDFLSYQQIPRTQAIIWRIGYTF